MLYLFIYKFSIPFSGLKRVLDNNLSFTLLFHFECHEVKNFNLQESGCKLNYPVIISENSVNSIKFCLLHVCTHIIQNNEKKTEGKN